MWNSTGADLRETNLSNADFKEADLSGANLTATFVPNTNFTKANVSLSRLFLLRDVKDAIWEDLIFEKNAIIDSITLSELPEGVAEKYKENFDVIDMEGSKNQIKHSIEFPPEYHEAGMNILNFFGTVLRKKYPDKKVKVKIEQDDLKVIMTIETEEGDKEFYEEELKKYGLVVTGKMPLEEFTNDPLLARELTNKLTIAKGEIEMQKRMLVFHEGEAKNQDQRIEQQDIQIKSLFGLIENFTQRDGKNQDIIEKLIDKDSESSRKALALLEEKIKTGVKEEDEKEFKGALTVIQEENPSTFKEILSRLLDVAGGTVAGTAGNLAAGWISAYFKLYN